MGARNWSKNKRNLGVWRRGKKGRTWVTEGFTVVRVRGGGLGVEGSWGMKSTSWSRKGVELDPMRGLGSGSRDCHSGDCWLTKNVRDGRMGLGSESVAADVSSWSERALLLTSRQRDMYN